MRNDVNIYQDTTTGGWVVEILALGEWCRLGVFGSRVAAAKAAQHATTASDAVERNAVHPRLFDLDDVERIERREGCAYVVTHDRRTMLPITHVSGHGELRVAHVQTGIGRGHPALHVNWSVSDAATGERLLSGCERNHRGDRRGYYRALKLAVRAVHAAGCEIRVRPGDRGPWGPGATCA